MVDRKQSTTTLMKGEQCGHLSEHRISGKSTEVMSKSFNKKCDDTYFFKL